MGDRRDVQNIWRGCNGPFDHDEPFNELIDLGRIKRQANICGGGILVGRP